MRERKGGLEGKERYNMIPKRRREIETSFSEGHSGDASVIRAGQAPIADSASLITDLQLLPGKPLQLQLSTSSENRLSPCHSHGITLLSLSVLVTRALGSPA